MVILSNFAERLKEYMSEGSYNVTTLAKQISCSRITVSALINGAHMPSTEILISLVCLFNCSADYLLGLTDYPRHIEFQKVKPFKERLKKCMAESGVSEYRLRTELGISGSLTYRWLSGKAVPTVDSLIRLKDYFDCSLDYLLGRES